MIEPKLESYKKCATDLAKISKQTLITPMLSIIKIWAL